jgi:acylphosphatase
MPELTAMAARRVRVLLSGDVQGVGFRWYCREEAIGRSVAGFVRNLPDGRVEATFEGEPAAVEAMVAWCRSGPGSARVDDLQVDEEAPTGELGFRIAH